MLLFNIALRFEIYATKIAQVVIKATGMAHSGFAASSSLRV